MKQKSKLSKINRFLAIVCVICLVATVLMVSLKPVPTAVVEGEEVIEDTPVIDEFVADTYGGVELKSQEDLVAYYCDAYNKTKAQTADFYYEETGETLHWYSMLCEEDLQVGNILVEGTENATINKLVPGIVGGLFTKGSSGLSPSENRIPEEDKTADGQSLQTCLLVPEDIIASNAKDNGDGTITLQIQPKRVNMSKKGEDPQGHLFNSLGAIDEVVDSITVLSWAEGTTADNCKVDYRGGYATVVIDTATGLITTADYHMVAHVAVTHANVTVLKNKSANLLITYDTHYPASEQYLKENLKVTPV